MREIMKKAFNALGQRRNSSTEDMERRTTRPDKRPTSPEDWGMSPEDALRVGTVARYK